ncbi:general transcriptional corepressor trfA-like isoform X2 [Mytilus californianus]|uniref:general transcriptional corepressor trfA-like isoform X2 n=1 Tax=Mytilus californianus TaxID=6549 RepID=UPI0022469389|nr:general transcriptional corepressor trfA-like isoform X2 [Mytilus californianus]
MATAPGEVTQLPGSSDDAARVVGEDPRDGKKKKFRPFVAMKKFFKGGSKKGIKSESAVAIKSRSLQAITQQDESDDDGGFRKRSRMGGSRSMSEDSVFIPEVKEPKMNAIRQTAISMESLNKDFQPLKSPNRGSDISIDTSEAEEDDPFTTDWRKSVASVSERKTSTQSLPDTVEMDLDLSAIGKETSTLSNDAARHRISVKRNLPKRRPSGTRKNKDAKRASAASPLPQVKEESPTKSDDQISPVTPEPLSPKSPVTPISPKPLSPKPASPKSDLFSKFEDKIPERTPLPIVQNVEDMPPKTLEQKKADEHKTVISIAHESETGRHISFGSGTKLNDKPDDKPPIKSMSLDRKMNYNMSDYSKPTDDIRHIAKLSRQRPKSLHDSMLPSNTSEADSELSKTFNKLKKNSVKEAESAIPTDSKQDTGFVIVGSFKNKDRDKDIPFGARRPQPKTQSTPFNEGLTTKPEVSATTTQGKSSSAKSDLVNKPAMSPTKQNITYVLKKEPLKSQSSLSGDKKDSSPSKPNVAMETKSERTDSHKDSLKQTLSDGKKEVEKEIIIDSKGAENTKDPKSNYENVILNFEPGSKNKTSDTKESEKFKDKVVIISADDNNKDNSSLKGRNSNYDNIIITTNDAAANKLASPREEYRLKRASRSRTLPEQPVTADILSGKATTRKDSLTQSFRIKEESIKSNTILETSETKPEDSKKLMSASMNASYSTDSTQPLWKQNLKKRQEDSKEKETELAKDKDKTPKPTFTGGRLGSFSDSVKEKSTPKSVFSSGSSAEPSKDKAVPKASESSGFKTSFKGSSSGSSEPHKDTKVNKPSFSGVGSMNKDHKDTKNNDKKTETKSDEKSQISASSFSKSFGGSTKSSATGRNVSLDTPKGWKSSSSKVKIEIIEKTEPSEESSKPPTGRTTTAKKTEEKPVKTVPEKCVDRKSKVLDMVKNFQNNLQVS